MLLDAVENGIGSRVKGVNFTLAVAGNHGGCVLQAGSQRAGNRRFSRYTCVLRLLL